MYQGIKSWGFVVIAVVVVEVVVVVVVVAVVVVVVVDYQQTRELGVCQERKPQGGATGPPAMRSIQ